MPQIRIINRADQAEINIEGVIGIPETWQFENTDGRVSTYPKFADALAEISATDIVVNIRSIGGSVQDALLIHDALLDTKKRVKTRCFGYTASAATVIAQVASDGSREMSANSLYLIHKSSSFFEGNIDKVEGEIGILRKTDERITNIYANRSGKPTDSFADLMAENNGNGRWLSPSEALEYGLIDKIISTGELTNYVKDGVDISKLPPLPKQLDEITPKPKNMKIKNTWNAILDFFDFDKDKENELTEAQVEKLNGELDTKNCEVKDLTSERDTLKVDNSTKDGTIATLNEQVTTLNKKVADLESERDQLKAKATATPPKEDPAPQGGVKSPRTEAYSKDAEAFKQ